MSNSSTLLDLRTRTRSISDQPSSTQNQNLFVTDSEINTWINVALSELHDLLVTEFEDFYENTASFMTVVNQEDYELSDDFYKLLESNALFPNGEGNPNQQRFSMNRFMNRERNWYWGYPVLSPWMTYRYRIVNAHTIRLAPMPTTPGQQIMYRYVPQFAPLLLDADLVEPSVPQGWEEIAVLDAASKVLIKEQNLEVAQIIMLKKEEIKQRIMTSADDRDANEDARVVDVARSGVNRDGGWWGSCGF